MDELRSELDRYLATEFGITTDKRDAYKAWLNNHQPFHWFVEFYGIMHSGGFDVIIGNPPYVEYGKVKATYEVLRFRSERTANLYAYTAERSEGLLHEKARLGLIIPVSFASSGLFESLRQLFWETARPLWLSHFSNRPGQLFSGAQNRLTILITGMSGSQIALSTKYHRWDEKRGERAFLFNTLRYVVLGNITRKFHGLFCKIGSEKSISVLKKIDAESTIQRYLSRTGNNSVHWVRVPGYFCQFYLTPPMARPEDGGPERIRGEVKTVHTTDTKLQRVIHALLNSSTYYLFFCAYSDGRHINPSDVYEFPLDIDSIDGETIGELEGLSERLEDSMAEHTQYWRKSGLLIESVDSKPCKPIIDEIDHVLGKHYGFDEEEVDLVINNDIKFRLGLNEIVAEDAID